ncbi:5-(carboxyamino)imidazole ribonucleotide synthase [Sphingomonas quercus]|uniref:N5-carboxyaminoimidazole ribonucleotide synthase n=1 Tax=Sphingomonas quercus TaxID=2842451 RepID=A0ABS6BIP0_9SPHN|nr:5-(carboxyamino)imidazole ribonucleotide synthase [Sphingomonas quercus]MBU3077050.1 5-(carboxyamino)imidazole ribonucleotide synthase [Sphingomonas quercus]
MRGARHRRRPSLSTLPDVIAPGATIGIVGGGQLGRMLAVAAAQLGYRCHIYAPEETGPAFDVAARWTRGDYADAAALAAFAATVDVVTYEFENLPADALAALDGLRPCADALEVAQDRLAEKSFVNALGLVTAPWRPVDSRADLDAAIADLGGPAILKTRRFGYDGKGQARLAGAGDAAAAWAAIGEAPAILEGFVSFEAEYSIILCRGPGGELAFWDAVTNVHQDGILATSTVPPAGIVAAQAPHARAIARAIAERLDYIGVLACEFFAGADGPVFNEMAPRVHNSGHWTIEGAITSQFENHIRAICGLPLGATGLTAPRVTMRNLIGDEAGQWPAILADPEARLHLYGKGEARPGRKMGHVTKRG